MRIWLDEIPRLTCVYMYYAYNMATLMWIKPQYIPGNPTLNPKTVGISLLLNHSQPWLMAYSSPIILTPHFPLYSIKHQPFLTMVKHQSGRLLRTDANHFQLRFARQLPWTSGSSCHLSVVASEVQPIENRELDFHMFCLRKKCVTVQQYSFQCIHKYRYYLYIYII